MHRASFVGIALLALAACALGGAREQNERVAILPGNAAARLLDQCSRSEPPPAEGNWTPTAADIARLEPLLPPALAADSNAKGEDFSTLFLRWKRQYVGLVRGGRRFLHGNFLPADDRFDQLSWRTEPMIVCDGGPAFFGVEFDVEAGRITHLAFNGIL